MKFLSKDWEMFYTTSQNGDEKLIDQISIDKINKRYVLDIGAREICVNGSQSYEPIVSCFVSRLVFDCILEGLKNKGFVEYVAKTEETKQNNLKL